MQELHYKPLPATTGTKNRVAVFAPDGLRLGEITQETLFTECGFEPAPVQTTGWPSWVLKDLASKMEELNDFTAAQYRLTLGV